MAIAFSGLLMSSISAMNQLSFYLVFSVLFGILLNSILFILYSLLSSLFSLLFLFLFLFLFFFFSLLLILRDTFVVRSLLVPSLMGLLLDMNWWPKRMPEPTKSLWF